MANLPDPYQNKPPAREPLDEDPHWELPHERETRHLGLWMTVFAWFSIILLLTLLFNSLFGQRFKPEQSSVKVIVNEGIQQTVIQRSVHHQYKAKGTINQHPVVFLLDTGATDVVISAKLAKKLKLKAGYKGYASTAAGTVEIFSTKIDELTIGHIRILNVRASINPSMPGEEVLLGMSALKHVTFTQRGDKLILSVEPN